MTSNFFEEVRGPNSWSSLQFFPHCSFPAFNVKNEDDLNFKCSVFNYTKPVPYLPAASVPIQGKYIE